MCSQHFKKSDFNPSGDKTRKFLKRTACPSIVSSENIPIEKEPIDTILIEDEPLIFERCGLCRTRSAVHQLHPFDEYNFTLMRKCIPFINFNINLMQKICVDCEAILNTFSTFIDKILIAQNLISQEFVLQQNESQFSGIKVEPTHEDENFNVSPIKFIEQINPKIQKPPTLKKLEILEIVDIKPLNFLPYETNALNSCEVNESYEERECQILSPPQLKVEIAEDGENELEGIKNYMLISSVYLHDHNYYMENQEINVRNVKTEYEVQEIFESQNMIESNQTQWVKICCKKKFKTFRHYLIHKVIRHKRLKKCKFCNQILANEVILKHHKKYSCKKLSNDKKNYKKVLEKIKKKHEPKETLKKRKSYSCPTCKKLFKGPKNLYQHKLSHRASNISCKICGMKFKRKHGLRQHIMAQHEKKKMYNCPICKHPYALKGDIKRCKHSDLRKNMCKIFKS